MEIFAARSSWTCKRGVLLDSASPQIEPLSRRSICRLLSRDGHLTLSAGDGREALEVFGREGQSIELVLMDLDMPELDGYGAMLEMRRRRPEVRVVFLTGFVTDVRKRELYEAGASVVLNKPCDAVTLREALALALSMSGNLSHSMIPTETR